MKVRFESLDSYTMKSIGSEDKEFDFPVLYEQIDSPVVYYSIAFGHKVYMTPRVFLDFETQVDFPRTQYVVAYDQFGDGILNPSFMRWFFSEDPIFKLKLGYRIGQAKKMVSGEKWKDSNSKLAKASKGFKYITLEPYIFYSIGSMSYEDASSYVELRLNKTLNQYGLGLETYFKNSSYALVLEFSTYNFSFDGMNVIPYANEMSAQKYYFGFKYNFGNEKNKLNSNRADEYTKLKYNDTIESNYRNSGLDRISKELIEKEKEELKRRQEKYIY